MSLLLAGAAKEAADHLVILPSAGASFRDGVLVASRLGLEAMLDHVSSMFKGTRSHSNESEGKEAKIRYIMKPKSELFFNLCIQGAWEVPGTLTGFIDAPVDGLQHGMNKRYQEKRSS
ncbi:hypothetical protein Q3G72_027513 [Acer saccharum]|nr:hypothetical protein Q3G72_027513 [Acer saccharum]